MKIVKYTIPFFDSYYDDKVSEQDFHFDQTVTREQMVKHLQTLHNNWEQYPEYSGDVLLMIASVEQCREWPSLHGRCVCISGYVELRGKMYPLTAQKIDVTDVASIS